MITQAVLAMFFQLSNADYVHLIDYLMHPCFVICLVRCVHYPPYASISDCSALWMVRKKKFGVP